MSVTLPASATRCLYALAEAQGEVLTHEQLMEIGWRRDGYAATDNSVRVMINKLRRAFMSLELEQQINLLAVTRSGYRLIINVPPAVDHSVPVAMPLAPPARGTLTWRRVTGITAAGITAGYLVALLVQHFFLLTPKPIDFVSWHGPAIPDGSSVWVPKGHHTQHALIETTLRTYRRYVLDANPDKPAARVLYVTLSSANNPQHQGVIACQQPFEEAKNACESFYFRLN
ncbi:helix-turn-helix domain-containing protein [Pantoea sp. BL1]|nr:helix-turn-helix domain-containing protein [Pantoea sp. BL1]